VLETGNRIISNLLITGLVHYNGTTDIYYNFKYIRQDSYGCIDTNQSINQYIYRPSAEAMR